MRELDRSTIQTLIDAAYRAATNTLQRTQKWRGRPVSDDALERAMALNDLAHELRDLLRESDAEVFYLAE